MEPIQICIRGPLRGGKNHIGITRTGRRYPLKSWALWRDMTVQFLIDVCPPHMLACPLKLTAQYWNGDRRKRDIPAMVDSLYHCLERANIIEDDSQIKELHWLPMGYDKVSPKTILTLEELQA